MAHTTRENNNDNCSNKNGNEILYFYRNKFVFSN